MKLKYSIILMALLLLQSCCFGNGEEIERVVYNIEDKEKIPYADDQIVDMITDEGFEFQLTTNISSSLYSDQEHCEDYRSFEIYTANLVSDLPNLDIQLRLNRNYDEINDIQFTDVSIIVNRIRLYYNPELPLDSIEINGTLYTDVFYYFTGIAEDPITEVLYSETNGILRINYLNGDYAEII